MFVLILREGRLINRQHHLRLSVALFSSVMCVVGIGQCFIVFVQFLRGHNCNPKDKDNATNRIFSFLRNKPQTTTALTTVTAIVL